MIYLDYSATTKVDEKVLSRFSEVVNRYYANPNQLHFQGKEANKVVCDAIKNIEKELNLKDKEIIFTSGASEANNTVIKGIKTNKRHIITTEFEHSSILSPLSYLQKEGYKVSFVKLRENGIVDLDDLKNLITDDTFLVSINAVNSEIGIRQPIEEISKIIKKHPGVLFHSDMTQIIGKDSIDINSVDLASFSAHKIYSFKGIGCLIKNKDIKLVPLIHGGKSTTIYRSGTPSTELIDSISTALTVINEGKQEKYNHVKELNNYIRNHIKKYDNIIVNSNDRCVPHILNISILGKDATATLEYFSFHNIMISTRSACSSASDMSYAVYKLTNRSDLARSSVRISLSYKTSLSEVDEFLKVLDNYMEEKSEDN